MEKTTLTTAVASQVSRYAEKFTKTISFYACTNIRILQDLLIKFDDVIIEPLSEAFGQNIETVSGGKIPPEKRDQRGSSEQEEKTAALFLKEQVSAEIQRSPLGDDLNSKSNTLSMVDKSDGKEASDEIELIVVRDVEQGKCAAFKKSETMNEKRSINEPKYTPVSFLLVDVYRRSTIYHSATVIT